jgi:hypothetical protein
MQVDHGGLGPPTVNPKPRGTTDTMSALSCTFNNYLQESEKCQLEADENHDKCNKITAEYFAKFANQNKRKLLTTSNKQMHNTIEMYTKAQEYCTENDPSRSPTNPPINARSPRNLMNSDHGGFGPPMVNLSQGPSKTTTTQLTNKEYPDDFAKCMCQFRAKLKEIDKYMQKPSVLWEPLEQKSAPTCLNAYTDSILDTTTCCIHNSENETQQKPPAKAKNKHNKRTTIKHKRKQADCFFHQISRT